MKVKEYDYYDEIANWSFDHIDYVEENFTIWNYEEIVKKIITPSSKVLDLGTAAGEKVLKYYPVCSEILATDYSRAMIKTAKLNLQKSGRKDVTFKVMNNLEMDTQDNYYDLVTARHTVIDPKQIYKTLKTGGKLIVRGVDKLDSWLLKRTFGYGLAYNDMKSISLIDYEAILDAGFKEVELIPLHVIEYYKTKEDLYALLSKVPILLDMPEDNSDNFYTKRIDLELFEKYCKENKTEKGIKLIRRYYGIMAEK